MFVLVVPFARPARQGLAYKAVNARPALQKPISVVKSVNHVQATATSAQVVPPARPARQGLAYKVVNARPAPQQLI